LSERLAAQLDLAALSDEEFVERAYRFVLRRQPDGDGRERALRVLADRTLSRATLLHELVTSDEYAHLRALDDAATRAAHARAHGERPRELRFPATLDERPVEIAWTLGRYRGERRVLDVGYAFAEPAYVAALLAAVPQDPVGVDLAERDVPGMRTRVADLRELPFDKRSFDVVFCISTLEHVGRDNTQYGVGSGGEGIDTALRELRRVLARRGRLFVTVPCGRPADHGAFVVDEPDGWRALFRRCGFAVHEDELYVRGDEGWRASDDLPPDVSYGEHSAAAVLCAELRPRFLLLRRV
jgi:O-antigen chain-terminating methyltransferase